uniref:Uncharacterized protein PB7E8.02 n=1 Tax=Lygus hesperus TaxID=30085 RepID=A0A0A9ZHR1_LYGHE
MLTSLPSSLAIPVLPSKQASERCRHRQTVQVSVNLRHCKDTFLISDLHDMFGTNVKLDDLIGRYIIVEGDRGADMGQIIAVLKSSVVAYGENSVSSKMNYPLALNTAGVQSTIMMEEKREMQR